MSEQDLADSGAEAAVACYRIAHGRSLGSICEMLSGAVTPSTPAAKLQGIKAWTCHFAMHVLHSLAVVSSLVSDSLVFENMRCQVARRSVICWMHQQKCRSKN